MRTVIVQGWELLPDGDRRTVEVRLSVPDLRADGPLKAEISSEGVVETGTGLG